MHPGRDRKRRAAIKTSQVAKFAAPWGPVATGARAFRGGYSPVWCPYVLDSPDWRRWMVGWTSQRVKEPTR